MNSAIITNIQGFSIHDGPGIRTVVFFKGCPLRCEWCANPECCSREPQVGFIETLCQQCRKCAEVCPNNAIRHRTDEYRINKSLCDTCGICVDNCAYGALIRYGDQMTVDEVWDLVERDKMFYDSSGGGVTASGGEPLLYTAFVRELFELCRKEQIGTCVETCGFVDTDKILEVIPVTDLFLYDLKLMDSGNHSRYTGHSNHLILKNAKVMIENSVKMVFRQPLIPGINVSDSNIKATAAFLKNLGETALSLELMPYHRMGRDKYNALNLAYRLENLQVMNNEEVEAIKDAYNELGINCTVSR